MILFLVFLLPVAVYVLVLGLINRRDRPLVLSGVWDFAGVLFAASGMLLSVCPGILAALHGRWRLFLLLGQSRYAPDLGEEGYALWTCLSLLYFLIVVAGAVLLLRRRRQVTAVYNVRPDDLDAVLARVFDRLGLSWARAGNQVFLKPGAGLLQERPAGAALALAEHVTGELPDGGLHRPFVPLSSERPALAVLELEPFAAASHVTMRWRAVEPTLRQEVERELVKELSGVQTRDNVIGGWLLTLAGLLFFAFFLGLALVILANLRFR